MKNAFFPIEPERFRSVAEQAVSTYVNKNFPKFFSAAEKVDMVSDVVFKMWRSRESFDPSRGDFSHWLWVIAKNAVKSGARAKYNRSDISVSLSGQVIPDSITFGSYRGDEFDADRDLRVAELQENLLASLKNERDRQILGWLIEGLTPKEIAEKACLSVENVYLIVHHLRRRLHQRAA